MSSHKDARLLAEFETMLDSDTDSPVAPAKVAARPDIRLMNPDDLRQLKAFLPRTNGFMMPKFNTKEDPLALVALEFYDLQLRLLEKKLSHRSTRVRDVYNEDLDLFAMDQEFMDRLSDVSELDGSRRRLVEQSVRKELATHVARARAKIDKRLLSSRRRHPSVTELLSQSSPIDRDIYLQVFAASGMIDSYFNSRKGPSNQFSKTIKATADALGALYSKMLVFERLKPENVLLREGMLDINYADLRNSNWIEVDLCLPSSALNKISTKLSASMTEVRSCYAMLEPKESLADVRLPEKTTRHIRALCEQFRESVRQGKSSKLLFLFKGAPGTGKTMTASAIAAELGLQVLRINFASISSESIANVVSYFAARAKAKNSLLLFDECEDMLAHNPYLGYSDGWSKILFERFEGVCVFTTNYDVPYGLSRRMTYVHEFKAPDTATRQAILGSEFKKLVAQNKISTVPDAGVIHQLAKDYKVPGGYFEQALQLAMAQSAPGTVETARLTEAFEHCETLVESHATDEIRESRITIESIKLDAPLREEVDHFVSYAKGILAGTQRSLMLPQGATALFSGPPGTGKTITAEAIASSLGMPFRKVSPSTFLSMWVGQTEQQIRKVFKEAQREKQLLFIDEAEGLFLDRQGATRSWEKTQADELLQQVEGFRGILIIATNFVEMIDAAFGRRFLFHMKFNFPDQATRRELWLVWKEQLGLTDTDLDALACGFDLTGGEIRNVAVRARATGRVSLAQLGEICEAELAHRTGRQTRKIGLQ